MFHWKYDSCHWLKGLLCLSCSLEKAPICKLLPSLPQLPTRGLLLSKDKWSATEDHLCPKWRKGRVARKLRWGQKVVGETEQETWEWEKKGKKKPTLLNSLRFLNPLNTSYPQSLWFKSAWKERGASELSPLSMATLYFLLNSPRLSVFSSLFSLFSFL